MATGSAESAAMAPGSAAMATAAPTAAACAASAPAAKDAAIPAIAIRPAVRSARPAPARAPIAHVCAAASGVRFAACILRPAASRDWSAAADARPASCTIHTRTGSAPDLGTEQPVGHDDDAREDATRIPPENPRQGEGVQSDDRIGA